MISVFGSAFGEEEADALRKVILSQWVGMGAITDQFEKKFAERLSLPDFVMVNSGSNALSLAVYLLNLPKKSEIILPSFTWVSCANAVLLAGHKPVFCDVDESSQNVTAETIRPHITKKTGAIMVVHYAGKSVDMDPILDLGIPIIEDAAHAVDTKYKNRFCGSMGDIGIFSFDSIKNLAIGEAGGITANKPSLIKRARELRYCGINKSGFKQAQENANSLWWRHEIKEIYHKLLPTDLSAALGIIQLSRLDKLQVSRKKIWDYYQSALKKNDAIKLPIDAKKDETHSFFTFLIQVEKRDQLAKHLYSKGIYTTLRYHPLHLEPIYKSKAKLTVTEQLAENGLNIPLHPLLKKKETEKITKEILGFLNKA